MKYEFHKSPWFLLLVAFAIWGCGYITADDNRIEREQKQLAEVSQIVKSHYAKECGK